MTCENVVGGGVELCPVIRAEERGACRTCGRDSEVLEAARGGEGGGFVCLAECGIKQGVFVCGAARGVEQRGVACVGEGSRGRTHSFSLTAG